MFFNRRLKKLAQESAAGDFDAIQSLADHGKRAAHDVWRVGRVRLFCLSMRVVMFFQKKKLRELASQCSAGCDDAFQSLTAYGNAAVPWLIELLIEANDLTVRHRACLSLSTLRAPEAAEHARDALSWAMAVEVPAEVSKKTRLVYRDAIKRLDFGVDCITLLGAGQSPDYARLAKVHGGRIICLGDARRAYKSIIVRLKTYELFNRYDWLERLNTREDSLRMRVVDLLASVATDDAEETCNIIYTAIDLSVLFRRSVWLGPAVLERTAIRALVQLGDPRVVTVLLDGLDNDQEWYKQWDVDSVNCRHFEDEYFRNGRTWIDSAMYWLGELEEFIKRWSCRIRDEDLVRLVTVSAKHARRTEHDYFGETVVHAYLVEIDCARVRACATEELAKREAKREAQREKAEHEAQTELAKREAQREKVKRGISPRPIVPLRKGKDKRRKLRHSNRPPGK